jgi:hypothetical protein
VRRLAAVVLAGAGATIHGGCDQLFQLAEVRDASSGGGGDDGGAPGDVGETPPDAQPLVCPDGNDSSVELPLHADTTLLPLPAGALEVLATRDSLRVLVTFDLQGLPIMDITGVRLELTPAQTGRGCVLSTPSVCEPCQQAAGQYLVYLSNPDWTEVSATTTQRTATAPWQQQNATGPDDRTAQESASHTVGDTFVHERAFSASALPAHWDRTRLSFHIETSGARAFFHSKEAQPCSPGGVVTPPKAFVKCRQP